MAENACVPHENFNARGWSNSWMAFFGQCISGKRLLAACRVHDGANSWLRRPRKNTPNPSGSIRGVYKE